MWKNSILTHIPQAVHAADSFEQMLEALASVLPAEENAWLFLEDNVGYAKKYWTYIGRVSDILALPGETYDDFYIVSPKITWLTGLDHHDVLFAYGDLAEDLERHFSKLVTRQAIYCRGFSQGTVR